MTPLSPLQLKGYAFSTVRLQAHPKGNKDVVPRLEPEVIAVKEKVDGRVWKLILTVKLRHPKAGDPFLYEGDFQVHSIFEVHPDFDSAREEPLVKINGAGILFSAVREMFLILSGRSVHGPVGLPSINFNEVLREQTLSKVEKPSGEVPSVPAT